MLRYQAKMRKNSQVAMEFVMFILLAFMIMVVFSVVTRGRMIDLREEEEYVALKDVVHAVQSEISIATGVEDGYLREFSIPESLGGVDYTIQISGGYIIAESKNHEYILSVPNVEGNITKGVNQVTKEGGTVYLN
jgi:hypothetical protein